MIAKRVLQSTVFKSLVAPVSRANFSKGNWKERDEAA